MGTVPLCFQSTGNTAGIYRDVPHVLPFGISVEQGWSRGGGVTEFLVNCLPCDN